MSEKVDRYIEQILCARSVNEIKRISQEIAESYGFDYFLYGEKIPTSIIKPKLYILSNYPTNWMDAYIDNHFELVDPTVSYCLMHIRPSTWQDIYQLHQNKYRTKLNSDFIDQANSVGLKSGVSIPLRGPRGPTALFSFASTSMNNEYHVKKHYLLAKLHYLAVFIYEALHYHSLDFAENQIDLGVPELTDKEAQCLIWTAEGKSAWDVSKIMNISEKTVEFHMKNIFRKLDVNNKYQATARGMLLGILEPAVVNGFEVEARR